MRTFKHSVSKVKAVNFFMSLTELKKEQPNAFKDGAKFKVKVLYEFTIRGEEINFIIFIF